MKMRTALSVVLIVVAVGLVFRVIIWPAVKPNSAPIVTDSQLVWVGDDADGEGAYVVLRREAEAWVGIICQLAPILAIVAAWKIKPNKKGA